MKLHIAGLEEAGAFRDQASHLICVIDPEDAPFIPRLGIPPEHRLLLFCHDVPSRAEARERERDLPGSRCIAPTVSMVNKALKFARALGDDDTLLAVCGHGVSRSTALAYGILCQAHPELSEREVLTRLLQIRPYAFPNPLIVRHADALLKRRGRMSQVIAQHLARDV